MDAKHNSSQTKKNVYWLIWIATILVLFACVAGYIAGKDSAFRDNSHDTASKADKSIEAGK